MIASLIINSDPIICESLQVIYQGEQRNNIGSFGLGVGIVTIS